MLTYLAFGIVIVLLGGILYELGRIYDALLNK